MHVRVAPTSIWNLQNIDCSREREAELESEMNEVSELKL